MIKTIVCHQREAGQELGWRRGRGGALLTGFLPMLCPTCFLKGFYYLDYVLYCLHMCLCTTCVQCPQRPKEGVIPYVCSYKWLSAPYGCWESNLGPLPKQPVPLALEPSLQPPSLPARFLFLFMCMCVFLHECMCTQGGCVYSACGGGNCNYS